MRSPPSSIASERVHEQEAFERRAATVISFCCTLLAVGVVLLYINAPAVLEALFRMFS